MKENYYKKKITRKQGIQKNGERKDLKININIY